MALIFGNSLGNNGEIHTTGIVADDHEIILRTNGLDRIYINNEGNMAIGQQQSEFDNSDKLLIFDETSALLRFKNSTTSSGTRMGLETSGNSFLINNLENGEIKLLTNGTNRLIITNEGNINIGNTTVENALLFVCKDTETAESTVLLQQNGTAGDCVLGFSLVGGQQWSMGIDNSDSDKFKINNASTISTVSEFVITNAGLVGIGTNSPSVKFEVGGTAKISGTLTTTGNLGVGTDTIDEELTVIGEAGKTVGGTTWNDNSDSRIKENIVDRDTAESLIVINALKLREFDFTDEYMEYSKNTQKHRVGLIAQEVELTHPESIITVKNPLVIGNTTINDFKKINMSQFNYELVGAIQELSRRLSFLENN